MNARKPAYLGQAHNGDRIAIVNQSVTFVNGDPVIVDTELVGTLSGMATVKQIPHSFIVGTLIEDNGDRHAIKSRPDRHIEFILVVDTDDELELPECVVDSHLVTPTGEIAGTVLDLGSRGVEIAWANTDAVKFYTWDDVAELALTFRKNTKQEV